MDFSPIKLTACDQSKVRKSSGSKLHYVVPFSLSAKPPRDWEDIFDDAWRAHRKKASGGKAQAYVRKGEIVIECSLDDLKLQFPNLRSSVDTANEKFVRRLQQKAEKDEKKKRKREEERLAEEQEIHEALEGLDFS